jgi:hypothetical protein
MLVHRLQVTLAEVRERPKLRGNYDTEHTQVNRI